MPKVEIDEVELLNHRRLAQTVNTILSNPKAKVLVQQAHKMVDPTARTPELDSLQAVNEPFAQLHKKVDDFITESKAERAEREKNEKITHLKGQKDEGIASLRRQGWTAEGITGVEKLMEEKGLLDPLDAAAIFEKAHPPQLPATPSGGVGAWNFTGDVTDEQADLKKLLETKGQSDGLADKMARDALTEVRNVSRR